MPEKKKKGVIKKVSITLGVLFLLYVIGGFWGVPLALRYIGLSKLNEAVAGSGEVEAFRFNPFTWELKIEGLTGRTPDGETALSFEEFSVQVQPFSVFADAYEIKSILLKAPQLNLIVDKNGQINIQSAIGKIQEQVDEMQAEQAEKQAESDEPFVIPAIVINQLQVIEAGAKIQIDSLSEPFVREIQHVSFEMNNVSTDALHENPYDFELSTARGETLSVNGNIKLDPLSSQGKIELKDLSLADFSAFAGDQIGLAVTDGSLSVGFDYAFIPLGNNPNLGITNGSIDLTEFALTANEESEPFQTISSMSIDGLAFNILKEDISLESFEIRDSSLTVVRDSDGLLSLLKYVTTAEQQEAIAAQAQGEKQAEAKTQAREIRLGVVSDDQDLGVALTSAWNQIQQLVEIKWNLAAGKVLVSNQSLVWRDEFLARPAELRFTEINLEATELTNQENAPFPYKLSLKMNDSGTIDLDGTFTPTPAASVFNFDVATLPLVEISPYLDPLAPVRLNSGALSAQGDGNIAFPDQVVPELTAEVSSGSLADLQIDWAEPAGPLLKWSNFSFSGITAKTDPMSATISEVTLEQPEIWIERLEDGSLRLPLPAGNAAEPSAAPTSDSTPAREPAESAPAFSAMLTSFKMSGAKANIKDQSVSPAVAFSVTEVQMEAGPLAYPDVQPLKFDIGSKLADGPSGTVKIKGALEPLKPLEATEISISTAGVTLPPFSAYAVSIIGQPPTSGSVTSKLDYKITSGQIDGANDIKIKSMVFGPRPENTDAPDLPLELGVAILEDSNGVMNIDIPVQGNTNDPEFTIDRMIQYAIGNVIEKLASAPFEALGGIFPGEDGDPADYVAFEPGQSSLSVEATEGLAKLAEVLLDRPLLKLELIPSIAPEEDLGTLRTIAYQAAIDARKSQGDNDQQALESLYDALPDNLKLPAGSEITPASMEQVVRLSMPVSGEQLSTLAQTRVEVVQSALLASGTLDASRITVSAPEGAAYLEEGAQVKFGLSAGE
ncbi:MAG: DUF748 domain-containing protein [Verrucomicrobiota bacterium]